jgi:hypothetical protein
MTTSMTASGGLFAIRPEISPAILMTLILITLGLYSERFKIAIVIVMPA